MQIKLDIYTSGGNFILETVGHILFLIIHFF